MYRYRNLPRLKNFPMVNHLLSNWNYILEEINQWYELSKSNPDATNLPPSYRTHTLVFKSLVFTLVEWYNMFYA